MKRYNKPTTNIIAVELQKMIAESFNKSTGFGNATTTGGTSGGGITTADGKGFDTDTDLWED